MYLAKGTTMVTVSEDIIDANEDYVSKMLSEGWVTTDLKKPEDGEYSFVSGNWVPVGLESEEVKEEKAWRNSELSNYVDHFQKVLIWNDLTELQRDNVTKYRRELLDYPDKEGFPTIERPSRPSEPTL